MGSDGREMRYVFVCEAATQDHYRNLKCHECGGRVKTSLAARDYLYDFSGTPVYCVTCAPPRHDGKQEEMHDGCCLRLTAQ